MQSLNSANNPIRISWISPHRWPGRLGLTIAPGKQGSLHGKTHQRDLNTDLQALKDAGTDLLVNLMELEEGQRWHMHDYDSTAARLDLNVRRFPIRDVDIPRHPDLFQRFVEELHTDLQEGDTIVIHCLGGLGRSGTLAACLLVQDGMNAHEAIRLVRECRPGAIQGQQDSFVETYAQNLKR